MRFQFLQMLCPWRKHVSSPGQFFTWARVRSAACCDLPQICGRCLPEQVSALSAQARGAICGTGAFCSIRFCALRSAQNSAGIFVCMEV